MKRVRAKGGPKVRVGQGALVGFINKNKKGKCGTIGTHKTLISCTNTSSKCIK
jgi:hypothetical protein